jgi:Asp/Glu/hydantoin racemase
MAYVGDMHVTKLIIIRYITVAASSCLTLHGDHGFDRISATSNLRSRRRCSSLQIALLVHTVLVALIREAAAIRAVGAVLAVRAAVASVSRKFTALTYPGEDYGLT